MQPLIDPLKDRVVQSVNAPPHQPLMSSQIWPKGEKSKPDWKCIKDHLAQEGRIRKEDFVKLIEDTNQILKTEGNLVNLQDPVTVVGDIHGQFYDLIKILEVGGNPEVTKYLFLGDFVDRGSFSIEVLILLYAIKLNFTDTLYLLRGNHECRQMTSQYKYDQEIYEIIMQSFDLLPLACIVNGQFLCLHGGISPDLKNLDDIQKIDRFKEPPRSGIFCDILWADPVDHEDGLSDSLYKANDIRGCSYFYGHNAARKFLENNNLISIIRAHQAQLDGYKMHRWNGGSDFPVIITIFSAPNYCDVYNNKGAVIKFVNNTLNIQQFNYTQHPYLLPHFMDIFTWSIPFIAEKITQMLYHVINKHGQSEELIDEEQLTEEERIKLGQFIKPKPVGISGKGGGPKEEEQQKQLFPGETTSNSANLQKTSSKADVLRQQIRFISKLAKLHSTLREESEAIMKLKGLCPDKRIPKGLLSEGGEAIHTALERFQKVIQADRINQKRPDDISITSNSSSSSISAATNKSSTNGGSKFLKN